MIFSALLFIVSIVAGAVAAISGFGIGSLLTPVLSPHYGIKAAVTRVSVPHLVGTAARFLTMKGHVDRKVFWNFGILSAAGGLIGALLHSRANGPALGIVFGLLLLFAGISGVLGYAERIRFGRKSAWFAGGLSGLFGGLVGNQGGIRSAALLGFNVSKEAFVATATAVALIVDGARMPVYFATQPQAVTGPWKQVVLAIAGVLLGTFWGVRLLGLIPEKVFRRSVAAAIAILGVYTLIQAAWK